MVFFCLYFVYVRFGFYLEALPWVLVLFFSFYICLGDSITCQGLLRQVLSWSLVFGSWHIGIRVSRFISVRTECLAESSRSVHWHPYLSVRGYKISLENFLVLFLIVQSFIPYVLNHISLFSTQIVRTRFHEVRDAKKSSEERAQSRGRVASHGWARFSGGHEDLPLTEVVLWDSSLSLRLSMLEIWGLLRSHRVLVPQSWRGCWFICWLIWRVHL